LPKGHQRCRGLQKDKWRLKGETWKATYPKIGHRENHENVHILGIIILQKTYFKNPDLLWKPILCNLGWKRLLSIISTLTLKTRGSWVVSKPRGLDLAQRGLDQDYRSWHCQEVSLDNRENLDSFKKLVSMIEIDFVSTPLSRPKCLKKSQSFLNLNWDIDIIFINLNQITTFDPFY
jgi:hypothetical protein